MTRTERNQQNAQHSTGPTTNEGKARSSQNALKTGLYSATALLSNEDPEEYRLHAESYILDLQPEGPAQADLVKSISDDVWCLRRIRKLVVDQQDRVLWQMDRMDCPIEIRVTEARMLESFSRHEQRTKNSIAKSLKLLKDLQKKDLQKQQPAQKATAAKPDSGFVPNTQFATAAAASSTPEFIVKTSPNTTTDPTPQEMNQEKAAA